MPAGALIHADRATLEAAFAQIVDLQPVRWADGGLICAPRSAPEIAASALRRCPFPIAALRHVPGRPDPPSEMIAGWYRRSPEHVPAPATIRELIQVPGDGFGWGSHPTTTMCLEAIEGMPAGPALDVGCGSGLLAQAWRRLERGAVHAIDTDPAAITQTRQSLDAAGLDARLECRDIASLESADLSDRVVFANIPVHAHHRLCERIGSVPPRAIVVSGLRRPEAMDVVGRYRTTGFIPRRVASRGRWQCWVLAQ